MDWDAVAEAITTRLAELDMKQIELAQQSGVSVATLRQLQRGIPKRRSPRTLADVSEALRWPPGHLLAVAEGKGAPARDRVTTLEDEVAQLRERVDQLERRVNE